MREAGGGGVVSVKQRASAVRRVVRVSLKRCDPLEFIGRKCRIAGGFGCNLKIVNGLCRGGKSNPCLAFYMLQL